ncbi:MAG: aldo/keto reductase [Bacteroidetes bacterium]|nr:aldo/keto reductase [Bacteroidota bacterium]
MATIPATIYYSSKFPDLKFEKLGKTCFITSTCGFGCYRVNDSVEEHHFALEYALSNGINLIDTSSNYSIGGSEKLIGNVLQKLTSEDRIILDEIILVTKAGYLQGDNLTSAKERELSGNPFPDVVKCSPDLWHCIHPDFLKDQLTNSLAKLQLKKVDIYLLHNPEYFLTYSNISLDEDKKKKYYRRIKLAFEYLESEIENGRISYYGISSNTFVDRQDKKNFTSLERVYDIASEISDDNHFAVIQFPLNLMEKGATINMNQFNNTKTLLQFAKEKNLGVLVNRPLNAIENNKINRLADFFIKEDRNRGEIIDLISKLSELEKKLIDKYVNKMNKNFSDKKSLLECLSLGKILESNYDKFESPNDFTDIKGSHLIPRANFAINAISKFFESDDSLEHLLNNFAITVNITLDSIESELARQWNENNKQLHDELNKYLNDEQKDFSLSQKAIAFVNSLNEVSSTLVGMRKVEYVNDVLGSIKFQSNEKLIEYWNE